MKALKHIAGIILAAFGIALTLGAVADALAKESETPLWMSVLVIVVLGLLPLTGAVTLLRKSAMEVPPSHCPKCGGTEQAPAGVLASSRSIWLMHFGGWLLASLWGASRQQQVRCLQCETLYFTETRGTRLSGILLWVFLLLMLLGTIAQHFSGSL